MLILQTYEDYLDDVLSLDMAQDAGAAAADKPNMFDFLVKEEPLGEDDLRAIQKDRQKKDNHNMSEYESGCHFTRERGTRFPDWLQISQTFFKKIRNF